MRTISFSINFANGKWIFVEPSKKHKQLELEFEEKKEETELDLLKYFNNLDRFYNWVV
jgi:hypothetical protein